MTHQHRGEVEVLVLLLQKEVEGKEVLWNKSKRDLKGGIGGLGERGPIERSQFIKINQLTPSKKGAGDKKQKETRSVAIFSSVCVSCISFLLKFPLLESWGSPRSLWKLL